MQVTKEMWIRSLGQEDSLQVGMTTHSSILVWRIPWTKEPGGLQATGHKQSDMTEIYSKSRYYTKSSLNVNPS